MTYQYNLERQDFRPVEILDLLHQEYSKPSDFRNAFQELISDIRREQEKRKQQFISIAAKVLNCPVDQVEKHAREIYQKRLLEDRRADIEMMKTTLVHFKMTKQHAEILQKLQQERPEANIKIESEEYDTKYHTMVVKGTRSCLPEEFENEKNMALEYSKEEANKASDRDLFNALRVQDTSDWLKSSQEEIALERAWEEWKKVFGDGNCLEYEMQKRYSNILQFTQKEMIENSIIDLPFTNLVDVAVWKTDEEKETGVRLTDEEFCRRYTYKHGRKINPGSLKAARDGTALYINRNARDVISNRQWGKS